MADRHPGPMSIHLRPHWPKKGIKRYRVPKQKRDYAQHSTHRLPIFPLHRIISFEDRNVDFNCRIGMRVKTRWGMIADKIGYEKTDSLIKKKERKKSRCETRGEIKREKSIINRPGGSRVIGLAHNRSFTITNYELRPIRNPISSVF